MDLSNQKNTKRSEIDMNKWTMVRTMVLGFSLINGRGPDHGPWIFVNKWTWSGPWSMDFRE